MDFKNIIKISALFVIFLLILTPLSLADEVSETYEEKPEDAKGSVVSFCSKPLKVKKDNRFFFFVNKNSSVDEISLVVTQGDIEFIEPLNPSKHGRDNVVREGRKITVKNTTSFILHSNSKKIGVATENKNLKLAATQRCAQLSASIAYMNMGSKREYIKKEVKPLDSLYNLTAELTKLKYQIKTESCSGVKGEGIVEGSTVCASGGSSDPGPGLTKEVRLPSDHAAAQKFYSGKSIPTSEIRRIYTEVFPQEYEQAASEINLDDAFSQMGEVDEPTPAEGDVKFDLYNYLHKRFDTFYLRFLENKVPEKYQNSFQEWKNLRADESFNALSSKPKTLMDMVKYLTTEEIFAEEDSSLIRFDELLNRKFESLDYRFEIITEEPKVDLETITSDGERLFPKGISESVQEIPRLNIYDESGELARADYIIPVRKGFTSREFTFDTEGYDISPELEGKLGGIGLDLISEDMSSRIPYSLTHESVHSLTRATGFMSHYINKLQRVFGEDFRGESEYKALIEGPSMGLAPEIMNEYSDGLKNLGWKGIGSRIAHLDEMVNDHGRISRINVERSFGSLLFRQAMEEYKLDDILKHEVDLVETYDLHSSYMNFKGFNHLHTTGKSSDLVKIREFYQHTTRSLDQMVNKIQESRADEKLSQRALNTIKEKFGRDIDTSDSEVSMEEEATSIKYDLKRIDDILNRMEQRNNRRVPWNEFDVFENIETDDVDEVHSRQLLNSLSDLNNELKMILSRVLEVEKIGNEEIKKINYLEARIDGNLAELGKTRLGAILRDLERIGNEAEDFPDRYSLEGPEQKMAGLIEGEVEEIRQDAQKVREISHSDPETNRIIETLDKADNSPVKGELESSTYEMGIWERAKEASRKEFKEMEWSSLVGLFRASAAEALAQALETFGENYNLAWTSTVSLGLHTEAITDYVTVLAYALAPKVLWGMYFIMNGFIAAGLLIIGKALATMVAMLILSGILIAVLTVVFEIILSIFGISIIGLPSKPGIVFEKEELKKNSEEYFYLTNIKNLNNYPPSERIHVKLISEIPIEFNSNKKRVHRTSCKIIRSSEGKVCRGKFLVDKVKDWDYKRRKFYSALYYYTKVPKWFGKVKEKIGKERITIEQNLYNTFLSFGDRKMCVKNFPYRKKCVEIDEELEERTFILDKNRIFKLWVEKDEVKCDQFTSFNRERIGVCGIFPSKRELPKGKLLSEKSKKKEVTVIENGKKLHGELEIDTKGNKFNSKKFLWKDEEILYKEDFVKK